MCWGSSLARQGRRAHRSIVTREVHRKRRVFRVRQSLCQRAEVALHLVREAGKSRHALSVAGKNFRLAY